MFYQKQGEIPKKRHIQFRDKKGSLYFEELISREGFSSIYSNVYHINRPTEILEVGALKPIDNHSELDEHKNRHFFTNQINTEGNLLSSRKLMLFNEDILIYKLLITENMDYVYRNSHYDELLYIQSGEGEVVSNFGNLQLKEGDYLVVPRGVIWSISIKSNISAILIESSSPIQPPSRYMNKFGQFMEHSPFCERDIETPSLQNPIELKEVCIKVRLNSGIQEYTLKKHPFDIVGWDGYYFPWKFNINDFEPITGSIHQPPPVHQTFESTSFVVCSFVSRLFDYHKDAIPAPYPHSNVDSDEVIFYSMGEFMSRKGIEKESLTLHPMGLVHGPQPGKYEGSIGLKKTEELAVMIDTFKPLKISKYLKGIEDEDYWRSWIK